MQNDITPTTNLYNKLTFKNVIKASNPDRAITTQNSSNGSPTVWNIIFQSILWAAIKYRNSPTEYTSDTVKCVEPTENI